MIRRDADPLEIVHNSDHFHRVCLFVYLLKAPPAPPPVNLYHLQREQQNKEVRSEFKILVLEVYF